ncbi:efflux RND transporter periplasmic adaptor subunit [Myxococcota bacterium]|nr:efflux RND transporter periplasmic adaptor subunit [Myxococcota bacterium]
MRTSLWVGLVALGCLGGGAWWWRGRAAEDVVTWRLDAVRRGDVTSTVSATGTLEAVRTVEVGTQVSGLIAELGADFNDTVKAGQVMARLDRRLLEAAVAAAKAEVDLREANAVQAKHALTRAEALRAQGAVSEEELETAAVAVAVADAQRRAAAVELDRARANLSYATITAPIDGTVIRRDVEVGQTVNAGTSAPTLFLLAGDLTQMRILAAVDESDIGKVKQGQAVRFTVQAYDDRKFEGVVEQVRLESTLAENVVTYTAVVSVPNPDGALLPGMTATVDFIVETVTDTLCAPNAALRFRPDDSLIDPAALAAREAQREAAKAEGGGGSSGGGGGRGRRGGGSGGTLYTTNAAGLLVPSRVKTGLSDGSCTVVEGEGLTEGLEVVTGQLSGPTTAAATTSPLSGGSSGGPPRMGGF